MNGRPWTDEEVAILRAELADPYAKYQDAANVLGRANGSVAKKAKNDPTIPKRAIIADGFDSPKCDPEAAFTAAMNGRRYSTMTMKGAR